MTVADHAASIFCNYLQSVEQMVNNALHTYLERDIDIQESCAWGCPVKGGFFPVVYLDIFSGLEIGQPKSHPTISAGRYVATRQGQRPDNG